MESLDRPVALNQAAGQIIQQLWMARAFAQLAEIAGRANYARSKVILPNPIRHHSSRERIRWASNSLGQFQTATPSSKGCLLATAKDSEKTARRFFSEVFAISTNVDADVGGLG